MEWVDEIPGEVPLLHLLLGNLSGTIRIFLELNSLSWLQCLRLFWLETISRRGVESSLTNFFCEAECQVCQSLSTGLPVTSTFGTCFSLLLLSMGSHSLYMLALGWLVIHPNCIMWTPGKRWRKETVDVSMIFHSSKLKLWSLDSNSFTDKEVCAEGIADVQSCFLLILNNTAVLVSKKI